MGLDQVKELTNRTTQRIIRFAPFTSVEDFLTRVDPRPQEVENLVSVGALDGLGTIPSILRRLQNGGWQRNQMSLFEWADSADSSEEDWTLQQKVDAQLRILGVRLDAHPLELVADKLHGTEAISTLQKWAQVTVWCAAGFSSAPDS
jgi:DNA polymerase III alpha subunit